MNCCVVTIMSNMGRVPPYNMDAERACLGSVLLINATMATLTQIVDEQDFYVESHRRIFGAMVRLQSGFNPIDHVTLGNELTCHGELEKIGGAMALDGLTAAIGSTVNVEHYARIVRKLSQVRGLIEAAGQMVAEGFEYGHKADDEKIDLAVKAFEQAASSRGAQIMPDRLHAFGDRVLESYERVKSGYVGIPFPWPTMNEMTMGQWPGTMTMFVARPGTGKTQVAIISARHAWSLGKRVLIVSPEMSKAEIAERYFVLEAGTSYGNVMRGTLSDFELAKLRGSIDSQRDMDGLWIMDATDDVSGKGIDAAIRACQPHYVAVDSIYMLKFKGDKAERTASAIDWFGQSTKRFNYAGSAYSQLNRGAELSEKKGGGVRLGTIALSDQIAWDAHAVFALEQDQEMKADKKMRFTPLKIRRGNFSDSLMVRWDFDRMIFTEMEKEVSKPFMDYGYDDTVPF